MSTSHPTAARRRRRLIASTAAATLAATTVTAGVGLSAAEAAQPRLSAACTPTYTPPIVTSFSLSPGAVDVRTKAKKVTVTIKAKDSDKGVGSVIAFFASPTKSKHTSSAFASLKRVSGTAKSGTWRGTATIPRWVVPGTWKLTNAYVSDKANATTFINYSQAAAKHWKRSFTVKSKADLTAPKLTSFSLTPTSVDTRSKAKKVTFTAKAKDGSSGVQFVSATISRTGAGFGEGTFAFLEKVKGTAKSGSYKGTATIPKWVGNGTWNVQASVYDKASNRHDYSTSSLKSHKWRHAVKVKSKTDTTPPTLAKLAFSPTSINVTNAPRKVNATATLKDSGSGVSYGTVTWTGPSGFSQQTAPLTRRSGSTGAGIWKGFASFGCFSEPGLWKASAMVVDRAGRIHSYSAAQLSASGKPVNLTVVNTNP